MGIGRVGKYGEFFPFTWQVSAYFHSEKVNKVKKRLRSKHFLELAGWDFFNSLKNAP